MKGGGREARGEGREEVNLCKRLKAVGVCETKTLKGRENQVQIRNGEKRKGMKWRGEERRDKQSKMK